MIKQVYINLYKFGYFPFISEYIENSGDQDLYISNIII